MKNTIEDKGRYTTTIYGGRVYSDEVSDALWMRGNADDIQFAYEDGQIDYDDYHSMMSSEIIRNNNFYLNL